MIFKIQFNIHFSIFNLCFIIWSISERTDSSTLLSVIWKMSWMNWKWKYEFKYLHLRLSCVSDWFTFNASDIAIPPSFLMPLSVIWKMSSMNWKMKIWIQILTFKIELYEWLIHFQCICYCNTSFFSNLIICDLKNELNELKNTNINWDIYDQDWVVWVIYSLSMHLPLQYLLHFLFYNLWFE